MHNTPALSLSRLDRTVQVFFLLAVFCVPFSTWLTNVFIGFTLLGFLASLPFSAPLRAGLRAPPGWLALALLALFVAGSAWSIAPSEDVANGLRKYARLLILPVGIALNWRDPALARRALRCLMAGLVVLASSSYLVALNMMPTSSLGWWRIGDGHDAFAFKNHITIGILLGFATIASFLRATWCETAHARLLWSGAGIYFAVPVIFLNQGRTGYVAILIGLITLFVLRVRVTPLRTLLAMLGITALFALFYHTSDNFKVRTDQMIDEIATQRAQSPNGQRLSYMQVGLQVVTEHPLIGIGTGSFATAYAPTSARIWTKGSAMDVKHQPHSEFLLVAVQLGLAGLVLYFTMLGTLLRPALRVRSFVSDSQVLLWTVYVSASSFNSLLWDTTEAYWFLLLSSCLYMASLRARAQLSQTLAQH